VEPGAAVARRRRHGETWATGYHDPGDHNREPGIGAERAGRGSRIWSEWRQRRSTLGDQGGGAPSVDAAMDALSFFLVLYILQWLLPVSYVRRRKYISSFVNFFMSIGRKLVEL
jgi:hypothetical protein